MDFIQPKNWRKPRGYSNAVVSSGKHIFVAGQVGWNEEETFQSSTITGQVEQALKNVLAILNEAGAKASHITRMTWYVTDKRLYQASRSDIGHVYRSIIGEHYPAMTLVEVKSLLEDQALVEIEVTAVIPE